MCYKCSRTYSSYIFQVWMVHCHNTHAFSENEGVRLIAVLFASIVFEIKSDDHTIS